MALTANFNVSTRGHHVQDMDPYKTRTDAMMTFPEPRHDGRSQLLGSAMLEIVCFRFILTDFEGWWSIKGHTPRKSRCRC